MLTVSSFEASGLVRMVSLFVGDRGRVRSLTSSGWRGAAGSLAELVRMSDKLRTRGTV
jgi:hypothetical protein